MSYRSQYLLSADPEFSTRSQAAIIQQANIYKDDGRADIASLSRLLLKGPKPETFVMINLLAASPGFADSVDTGDGTIDSSLVTDPQILSAVQAVWPTVAALYFQSDGTPIS